MNSGLAPGSFFLGTSDIQSLADLANSYAVVREMRPVPFALNDVVRLAIYNGRPDPILVAYNYAVGGTSDSTSQDHFLMKSL